MVMVVTKDGAVLSTGKPSFYVENEVFKQILKSKDLAIDVFNFFGKPTLIGRLGNEISKDTYSEIDVNCSLFNLNKKVIDFYAKI